MDTVIGKVPAPSAINIEGLKDMTPEKMAKVLNVDKEEWKKEIALIDEHYARFGSHLPKELAAELQGFKQRLGI